jgi:phage protein U
LDNDFQSFNFSQEYGYGVHSKLVRKPTLQSVGDELGKIQFDLFFHRQLIDPELGILQLRTLAQTKRPQGLVFGEIYKGQWVITNLQENILKVEFQEDEVVLNAVAHRVELIEFSGVELRSNNQASINPFGFLA